MGNLWAVHHAVRGTFRRRCFYREEPEPCVVCGKPYDRLRFCGDICRACYSRERNERLKRCKHGNIENRVGGHQELPAIGNRPGRNDALPGILGEDRAVAGGVGLPRAVAAVAVSRRAGAASHQKGADGQEIRGVR